MITIVTRRDAPAPVRSDAGRLPGWRCMDMRAAAREVPLRSPSPFARLVKYTKMSVQNVVANMEIGRLLRAVNLLERRIPDRQLNRIQIADQFQRRRQQLDGAFPFRVGGGEPVHPRVV